MLPKISCLTVTGWRLILLKEAIACYLNQTYPNRELVIVCDGTPAYRNAIQSYVATLNRKDIKLVLLDQKYKLGALRNMAIDAAEGEIIVQWDDDDLYHPLRLQLQFARLQQEQANACLLSDHLSFFQQSREMYWVNWVPHSNYPMHQVFPGSIMAYKDERFRYPEEGEYSTQGEDSIFLQQYYQQAKITPLSDKGFIYVYRYHGTNTFPEEHHRWVSKGHVCEPVFVHQKMKELIPALSYYPLPQPFIFLGSKDEQLFAYKANH